MITEITYQSPVFNKKSRNAGLITRKIYGELNTLELEGHLQGLKHQLDNANKIINELNKNLACDSVLEAIATVTPITPTIIAQTRKRRTYSIFGLTIHEDDTITPVNS